MQHEFSNHIFPWLVTGSGVLLLIVVGTVVVGQVVERRRERLRVAEADAVQQERAATAEALAAQPEAALEAWLADVGGYRRRDLANLDESLVAVYELAYEGIADPAEHAHSFAELTEQAARPLSTAVDATDTREWSQDEIDELQLMLAVGQFELDAERAVMPV